MIRSLDTINRNVNILQKRQENISANVANINTSGYKSQELIQSTMESAELVNFLDGPQRNQLNALGQFTFGNQIDEAYRNFSNGTLRETASNTDLALQGDGFFTVAAENGQIYYTRNGNFTLNPEGSLVTLEGHFVQGIGADGQIGPINAANQNFTVDANGFIAGTGTRLLITEFENPNALTSVGDTLFTGEGGIIAGADASIQQRFLETSNVNTADEIVQLMQVAREFEANQKLLQTVDETLQKAVNEVGRV